MQVDTSKLPPIRLEEGAQPEPAAPRVDVRLLGPERQGERDDGYSVDFELFYKCEMEKIIDQVKERLAKSREPLERAAFR